MGVPLPSAVLQCAREEGMGDTRGKHRDGSCDSQLFERAGLGGGDEVGEEAAGVSCEQSGGKQMGADVL